MHLNNLTALLEGSNILRLLFNIHIIVIALVVIIQRQALFYPSLVVEIQNYPHFGIIVECFGF